MERHEIYFFGGAIVVVLILLVLYTSRSRSANKIGGEFMAVKAKRKPTFTNCVLVGSQGQEFDAINEEGPYYESNPPPCELLCTPKGKVPNGNWKFQNNSGIKTVACECCDQKK